MAYSNRPKLFIGSSSEQEEVAYALQAGLSRQCEVTVWTQDVFKPGEYQLESLIEATKTFEAAAFIYAPDDKTVSRGTTTLSPRDNIIFETGLFIGKLGPRRCFILTPQDTPLKLPSDLLGVTRLEYDASHSNLEASVGPAALRIRKALLALQLLPVDAISVPSTSEYGAWDGIESEHSVDAEVLLEPPGDRVLTEFLCSYPWRLVFRPDVGRAKLIEFGRDGQIKAGNNANEHAWQFAAGVLTITRHDGTVHNRFRFDTETINFVSTDDADTYAIREHQIPGQFIEPMRHPSSE